MARHFLFGPVTQTFAEQNLHEERALGNCLTFGPAPGVDLVLNPDDTWDSVATRFPANWHPDFIAVYMQYRTIPPWIWSAPIPIIALAGDWNLLWQASYRRQLQLFDLVFTDALGVEVMAREGIQHARAGILFGGERAFLEALPSAVARDIDILFVGNFHPAVQRERLPWLSRVAALGERWKVVLATNVHGDAYRQLLARTRIVFNRGIRGEWNLRVTETLAAGALLFQEADNREVPSYLQDRRECVYYTSDNLEALLQHYLDHEDERVTIADAGRRRAFEFAFGKFWHQHLGIIEQEWHAITARAAQRPTFSAADQLRMRAAQIFPATVQADPSLLRDLEAFLSEHSDHSALHNAHGYALAMSQPQQSSTAAAKSFPAFQKAWDADARNVLAGLNVVETLLDLGRRQEAIEQAQKSLAVLQELPEQDPDLLDGGHYPVDFDYFRVEWERAAWLHVGHSAEDARAKHALIRWRLHVLLADLTGHLEHFEQAAHARPDMPTTQAALGCALARVGRFMEAVEPLQKAVQANPFDRPAARALFQVYKEIGDSAGQERLIQQSRLLHKAAPQLVQPEPWFAGPLPQSSTASPFKPISLDAFYRRYGQRDFRRAVHGFTPPRDANIVLTLLMHARPLGILEIGTAAGHMTANLTEWSPEDAQIFSLGVTSDMNGGSPTAQRSEDPPRHAFGREANAFGKAHKVLFITADSMTYDFRRLAPLDLAFIDGAHDLDHVLSDSLHVEAVLRPGGWILWHDFNSPTPWVRVREALERLPFAHEIEFVEGTEVAFYHKPEPRPVHAVSSISVRDHSHGATAAKLSLLWEGDHAALHSLSLVNRNLCEGLLHRGHQVALTPDGSVFEVCIRHQWPPNLTPPPHGHWVMMQPWEFGSLPKAWVAAMSEKVDECWVNTRYVRDLYVESGIPAQRVHVVPLGVDTRQFHPQTTALRLQTTKRWRFLFVGGTIFRKGIDVLLEAYVEAFRRYDDVCLVIKDMGVGTFYQAQTAEARIAALQADPEAPEIEYLSQPLSADEMAGLYTACDFLAHPYRGEGFGLPIAEAMASGLAVIVTGMGAALDFCSEEHAYLIPARKVYFSKNQVGDLETVGTPWLAEPDRAALVELLRHVVAHPEEARATGKRACEHIRCHFTWQQSVEGVENRLMALRQQPIRRMVEAIPAAAIAPLADAIERGSHTSLCMIVKNEENMLDDCLRSVAGLFGEIVIVDTGSTDRTKDIARSFGAKVIDFAWADSFAAARNESLRHATGRWILWLDADERLDTANRARLEQLLSRLGSENVGYLMRQSSQLEHGPQAVTHVDQVRLFPNHPGLRWQYRVHEQILPGLRSLGADVQPTDIVITHVGFADPRTQGPKVERNLRLLRLELQERPNDTFILYNLGAVAITQNRVDESLGYFERCLALSTPGDHMLAKVHSLIARGYQQQDRQPEALAACRRGRQQFPEDPELLFLEAVLLHQRKDLAGAERALREILRLPKRVSFAGSDSGLYSYRPRLFLTQILREQNRYADAEATLSEVVAECPSLTAAWRQLAEVCFEQSRWTEMQKALRHLAHDPAECLQGDFLLGQAYLLQKEYGQARTILESVVARAPEAIEPKVMLSRAYLNDGKDFDTAERLLREILARDPQHREANHNLQVLQRIKTTPPADLSIPSASETPQNNGWEGAERLARDILAWGASPPTGESLAQPKDGALPAQDLSQFDTVRNATVSEASSAYGSLL